MAFSDKYLQHFTHPIGVGEFDPYDGIGEVEHSGSGCFDRIKLTMRIHNDTVTDIAFRARACSGTIASCSALADFAAGKSISKLLEMKADTLINMLDGIPENKQHSVELAVKALKQALEYYGNTNNSR